MRHVLATTPRTGSHYLMQLILQKTSGTTITKTHILTKEHKNIITIARDPKDTILSNAVMNAHAGQWKDYNFSGFVKDYIEMCTLLYNQADIIIDYNDLVNHPDEVVKSLAKAIGIEYTGRPYLETLEDNPDVGYIVSSTSSILHPMIEPLMDTLDLSKAYDIYNKMLSRAIPLI